MFNPGSPLPPEFTKIEREYRNERRRSGSSADFFTSFVVLLIIFARLFVKALWLPVKWAFFRNRAKLPSKNQQTPETEQDGNWRSRS